MENASKALIMAGSILIGVLLVALMVYFFTSASGVRRSYSQHINNTRMTEFNTKFTKYAIGAGQYINSGGTDYATIHDIITLANYAEEFNEGLDDDSYDFISIEINGSRVNNSGIDKNQTIKDNETNKYVLNGEVVYNQSSGRVQEINFRPPRSNEVRQADLIAGTR